MFENREYISHCCLKEFLSSKGYVHRDLAARNILVTGTNVAKIANFGLCRLANEMRNSADSCEFMALKWSSPEAVKEGIYSSQSDV